LAGPKDDREAKDVRIIEVVRQAYVIGVFQLEKVVEGMSRQRKDERREALDNIENMPIFIGTTKKQKAHKLYW